MLREELAQRHIQLERELSQLCYRRLVLTREIETIDKRIGPLEGGLAQIEAAQRTLDQEAAQAAKEKTTNG